MFTKNYNTPIFIHPIVMEASSPEDKQYINKMSKNDIHKINGTLVQQLYSTILTRKNLDFGDIPKSKGDITKCKYYDSIMESLTVLKELMTKNGIPTTEVDDIFRAVQNVKQLTPQFSEGFQLKQEYVILSYNTIVMAIMDTLSMLIANYINYLLGPEQDKFDVHNHNKQRGMVTLDNVRLFNTLVNDGRMEDSLNYLLKSQQKQLVGTGILITGGIVFGLLSCVNLTREAIYFYYRSRVKLSDYLLMQSRLLEANKLNVEFSTCSQSRKKDIIKRQKKIILSMTQLADKLKINNEDVTILAKKDIDNDDRSFSLSNLEPIMAKNQLNGTGFSIA